jgi:hypothetical protein
MRFSIAGLILLTASLARADEPLKRGDPTGWFASGSAQHQYDIGIDHVMHRSGKGSGMIRSKAAKIDGFGSLAQEIKADDYRGKRLRLSAYVRSANVAQWAGMFMRVDTPSKNAIAFDNMIDRAVEGTTDWTKYEIVLDVAPEASKVAFGLIVNGPGTAWIDDVRLDVVDASVPVTDQNKTMRRGALTNQPANLDFEKD